MAAAEYRFLKDVRSRFGEKGVFIRRYFSHPNRTLNLHAEMFRRFQHNGRVPCSQMVSPEPQVDSGNGDGLFPKLWLVYLTPNSVGKTLVTFAEPIYHRMQFNRCYEDTKISAIQALVGLKAYQARHNQLPETLKELVPDFLQEIPVDAFNGLPLHYVRDKRLLYSVGDDLVDTGGMVGKERQNRSEPSWTIPFGRNVKNG